MECPPPTKQAKLCSFGLHTSTPAPTGHGPTVNDATVSSDVDSVAGTRDRETDESPEPRSSSSPLLVDSHNSESGSSSMESALGKPICYLILVDVAS